MEMEREREREREREQFLNISLRTANNLAQDTSD
jgi:hypothetical protein